MLIKKLLLKNFRNYEMEEITFESGVNIMVGDNAQGKTNSAEAVFYLCTGYSPRAGKDKQVIRYGEKSATVKGIAESRYGDVEVEITFTPTGKDITLNGVPLKKIGELMGNINSVFFNPADLKLIQESPEDRRRFMDVSLSQMDKQYFYALQKYRKILQQRNDLLKNPDKEVVYETLPLWDVELSKVAVEVIEKRQKFIEALTPHAKAAASFITDNKEELSPTNCEASDIRTTLKKVKSQILDSLNKILKIVSIIILPLGIILFIRQYNISNSIGVSFIFLFNI